MGNIDKIEKLIKQTETELEKLEKKNLKSWDETKKNNEENFTPKVEKLRQYYLGMIFGLALANDAIK